MTHQSLCSRLALAVLAFVAVVTASASARAQARNHSGLASFIELNPSPTPRQDARFEILHDGRILAIGGYHDYFANPQSSCDIYDPWSGNWTPTDPMPGARAGMWSVVLNDGRVLAAGGDSLGSPEFPNAMSAKDAYLYDPRTGHWTTVASMPGTNINFHGRMDAILLDNGLVLVAGGARVESHFDQASQTWIQDINEVLSEALLYTPPDARHPQGSWARTGDMNAPRCTAEVVKLLDGRVLHVGGIENASDESSATGDVYDPRTGKWKATPLMPPSTNDTYFPFGWNTNGPYDFTDFNNPDNPGSRWQAASSLLDTGEVMIAGGTVFNGPADAFCIRNSVIIYQPWSNTWREIAPMGSQRSGARLVHLGLGDELLAVGSSVFGFGEDPSSEIYSRGAWAPSATVTDDPNFSVFDGHLLSVFGEVLEFEGVNWNFSGPVSLGGSELFRYQPAGPTCDR